MSEAVGINLRVTYKKQKGEIQSLSLSMKLNRLETCALWSTKEFKHESVIDKILPYISVK